VELVPLMVPADPGHGPSQGSIPDAVQQGWLARIGGAEFPVLTYGVEPAEFGGTALVTLVVAADAVSVGDQALGAPAAAKSVPEKKRGSWGDKVPDPREGIAGWAPEQSLGQQVADNAQQSGEPLTVHYDASAGAGLVRQLRTYIRRNYPGGGIAEAMA
jgi:hypothetical protein